MPFMSLYLDDTTLAILQGESVNRGRTVEDLAEAAISEAAHNCLRGAIRSIVDPSSNPGRE